MSRLYSHSDGVADNKNLEDDSNLFYSLINTHEKRGAFSPSLCISWILALELALSLLIINLG